MREYYYEMVYILKPTMSDEETGSAIEKVNSYAKKYNGEVLYVDEWGRRKLAYPIKDYDKGIYVLEYIKTNDGNFVSSMEQFFRLNEDVIRFLAFRLKPSEVKRLKNKLEAKVEAEEIKEEE